MSWKGIYNSCFSAHVYQPWGPSSLLYNGYQIFFLGVKRSGRGVDHPPPSSAEVKERVELYLYSSSRPSMPVLWQNLPYQESCKRLTSRGVTLLWR
jgi:hypothetical protein